MPTYNPKVIEPRWQRFWEDNKTFRTPDDSTKPKYYILDMFPYPSGAGLHVGHPEGYTATDILARYKRMKGFNVLHPMGWDAFGLPAEQYAIETGTHPRETTQKNIDTFRRQIKMLGFSYDWDREVDTTDPKYFRWTQWIFLQLFDTWYDTEQKRGRPINELPIPPDVKDVRAYQDSKRLAYQIDAPVNWCPALGTVLANEEVVDGKSERGGHPVVRMPLRQWMLRITAYAERLLDDLSGVDWSEAIKEMQRNWIGKSEGAEVDFLIASPPTAVGGKLRVFTTRPDTLFGATYMVLAPEHPLVAQITTPEQRAAVDAYKADASRKSDLERTELAKTKTGVFTGAFAINPVNNEKIPIWVADYVLATYGTGAIMAVPAHDDRDFDFAKQFHLPIRRVVQPVDSFGNYSGLFGQFIDKHLGKNGCYAAIRLAFNNPDATVDAVKERLKGLPKVDELVEMETAKDGIYLLVRDPMEDAVAGRLRPPFIQVTLNGAYTWDGIAVNSGPFDGLETFDFKQQISRWLEEKGLGGQKINYKLRDWLFSRQRYWGEPFPILHELGPDGKPTGRIEPLNADELPLTLPELADYQPSGKPEPPLGKATDWVKVTRNGKQYARETNTMPQWAGSCWYYLRFADPRNEKGFIDPAKEKNWLPVDLYVGGAEHAVLHLLYSRFWHKVLYDCGHVHTPEPFQKLVNQGMILGWVYKAWQKDTGEYFSDANDPNDPSAVFSDKEVAAEKVEEREGGYYLVGQDIKVQAFTEKMSKSRGNVINPDQVVNEYGADSMRLYEMFMGPLEATKPWSMRGVEGVYRFLNRVWRLIIDERAEELTLTKEVQDIQPDRDTLRELHRTIKKVSEDLDAMRFNTAISAMMEFSNFLMKQEARPKSALSTFVLLLSPFAPHVAEELWRALGNKNTPAYETWPTFDESLTKADEIEVPVQVNGKLRARLMVPAGTDQAVLEKIALADEKVRSFIDGKTIRKIIVVPGKLVNIVVS